MGTKSRETIYGSSIRALAERAKEARKEADRLACEAWNQRMLGYRGPAQPSPALGDALNGGYLYLESAAWAATHTKRCRWTLSVGRRRPPSTNWSATCVARTARRFGAHPTSAAIWWPCGQRKSLPTTRRPPGGLGSDDGRRTVRSWRSLGLN
jgi:hypothetical protein